MKASDLLGRRVVDAHGADLGVITDLRCIQDGPLRGSMAAPRVQELIVSPRRVGSLLGYDRRDQQGPWLIRVIVRRLHRRLLLVPWEAIEPGSDPITLTLDADDLRR